MGGRGREGGCLGVGPRPHRSDIPAGPAAAASAAAPAICGLFLYFGDGEGQQATGEKKCEVLFIHRLARP